MITSFFQLNWTALPLKQPCRGNFCFENYLQASHENGAKSLLELPRQNTECPWSRGSGFNLKYLKIHQTRRQLGNTS
ncbi:MAG: hypothetical protein KME55_34845 [Nostoc indistinguendum CM1-VF10]|nr:hypothetical protein [Nostoc indistinguendum CM1-VF10]